MNQPGNSYTQFDYPDDDPLDTIDDASQAEALDALRGVIHLLLTSRSPKSAWRRLHLLAWELRMLPEISSQRALAQKLGISDGQVTNLKSELAVMAENRRLKRPKAS